MSKISIEDFDSQNNILTFHCPGCEIDHQINIDQSKTPKWIWNFDRVNPTITPSILVRSGHYTNPGNEATGCWCIFNRRLENPSTKFKCMQCHSFITDGKIQFLSDCNHSLAGQTVDLPDYIVI